MSCSTNSLCACQSGTTGGISVSNGKAAYATGMLAATHRVDRVGQAAAPAISLVTGLVAPTHPKMVRRRDALGRATQGVLAGASMLSAVSGKSFGPAQAISLPVSLKVNLVTKAIAVGTGAIGTGLAELSQTGDAKAVTTAKRRLMIFKSQRQVPIWRSGLSRWLNGRDLIGLRNVTKSSGAMFQAGGKSWHNGAVSFKTEQGQTRTVAHLQSLSLPAAHYYFDRPLSNEQAVALAAGRVKPETVPGFAGKISPTEGLCRPWLMTKQALILARLHWQ